MEKQQSIQWQPIFLSAAEAMTQATSQRLLHRFLLHHHGQLFPPTVAGKQVRRVLNFTCGCGIWAIDLAKAYPHMEVVGLDIDPQLIRIANEYANAAGTANANFAVYALDSNPPPYPPASFDCICMWQPINRIPLRVWPVLLRNILSLLRPGGFIILTDCEIGPTSSSTATYFLTLLRETLRDSQRSISSDGMAVTPAIFFPRLLTQAGCADVHYTLLPVDLGKQQSNQLYYHTLLHLLANTQAIRFLLQQGILARKEIDELLAQIRQEVQAPDFCGTAMLITSVGVKPLPALVKKIEDKEVVATDGTVN